MNERTRAILPVEVFGNPHHLDTIRWFADCHQLALIEDSCEALGSTLNGQPAGTFGDLSVFAFYPNKQITTGEGGMILTDNSGWAEQCISLRNQGRASGGGWLCHERLGYNFRLSDINAAVGLVQLDRLEEIKAKRARVAQWYLERLAHETRLTLPQIPHNADISWFVFVVRLTAIHTQSQRDTLLQYLTERGIQASNYFPPVHLQPFIAEQYGYRPGDFPITEAVAQRTLALPFYNNLREEQVDYVCTQLLDLLDRIESISHTKFKTLLPPSPF
jgi:perosamine synthetase